MRREGFSALRVSQEGTPWLRSLHPAEVHHEKSQAGPDAQSSVLCGCSELKSFPKSHVAAQQRALQAAQTGADSPSQRQRDGVSSLSLRKHGVRIQACSPNPPSRRKAALAAGKSDPLLLH